MTIRSNDPLVVDRYRIDPGRPLRELDQPCAKAFGAVDLQSPSAGLFALVCGQNVMPRIDTIASLMRHSPTSLVSPLAWDVVDWPAEDCRRPAIVFPMFAGKRVGPRAGKFAPFSEDQVIHDVLPPLVSVIRDLGQRLITHRAIRVDNLFVEESGAAHYRLGECVSEPAAISQPVVYETIENGQCVPSGRGTGRIGDDIYALGALISVLLVGGGHLVDLDDQSLMLSKITQGSYSALVGGQRLSLYMMEAMRGLLCDDPKERWKVDDLDLWLSGRHQSPKQVLLPQRAQRPLAVGGRRCETDREAAHLAAIQWEDGVRLAKSGELDGWMRRSFGDEERAKKMAQQRLGSDVHDEAGGDILLTRMLTLLDPRGPLRYKGVAVRLEGLAGSLALDFHTGGLRDAIGDIIAYRLPLKAMSLQPHGRPEFVSLKKLYDSLSLYLDNEGMGFGIERCLYEANPTWPCLSPLVEKYCVCRLEQLLPALEDVCARRSEANSGDLVDRHIAAFCATHMKGLSTRLLQDLDRREDVTGRRLAMLGLLAAVQEATGHGNLPNLAQSAAVLLEPVIQSFHNRPYREGLIEKVGRISAAGDLGALLSVVGDELGREADRIAFAEAQSQHRQITDEIAWLNAGGLTESRFLTRTSRQSAIVLSTLISVATIVATAAAYIF